MWPPYAENKNPAPLILQMKTYKISEDSYNLDIDDDIKSIFFNCWDKLPETYMDGLEPIKGEIIRYTTYNELVYMIKV